MGSSLSIEIQEKLEGGECEEEDMEKKKVILFTHTITPKLLSINAFDERAYISSTSLENEFGNSAKKSQYQFIPKIFDRGDHKKMPLCKLENTISHILDENSKLDQELFCLQRNDAVHENFVVCKDWLIKNPLNKFWVFEDCVQES